LSETHIHTRRPAYYYTTDIINRKGNYTAMHEGGHIYSWANKQNHVTQFHERGKPHCPY